MVLGLDMGFLLVFFRVMAVSLPDDKQNGGWIVEELVGPLKT
jgi:hypothetical protein